MASHNFSTCCRLCLDTNELKTIFGTDTTLSQNISLSLGVVISNNDKLTTLVCTRCIDKVNSWQCFKRLCAQNQSKLEQWLAGSVVGDLSIQIKEEPIYDEEELVEELPPLLTPQKQEEPQYESPPQLMNESNVEANEKKGLSSRIKCLECDRTYTRHANMMRHYRSHTKKRNTIHTSGINEGANNQVNLGEEQHLSLRTLRSSQKQHYRSTSLGSATLDQSRPDITDSMPKSSSFPLPIDKLYKCQLCDNEYAYKHNLKRHMHQKHNGVKLATVPFSKNCCDREFTRLSSYTSHINQHRRIETNEGTNSALEEDEESGDESYFTCKRCYKVFGRRETWRRHMRSHRITVSPIKRAKTPTPAERMNDSDEDMMPILTPALSNDESSKKNHEKTPARKIVGIPKTTSTKIVCKKCKIAFENEIILIKHMQIEHMVETPSMMIKKNQIDKERHEFRCKTCQKSFKSRRGLSVHYDWHRKLDNIDNRNLLASSDPFEEACSKCNEMFTNQDELEKHKKLHHVIEQKTKDKTNFWCTHCPAAYSEAEKLKVHLKQAHLVEQFSCSRCDRIFDKQISLQIHLKVHEKQKVSTGKAVGTAAAAAQPLLPLFSCSICKQGFNVPKDLSAHVMKEHSFGRRADSS